MSPAIDSVSVKKHNRVKSVLKSGEERSSSVPFLTLPLEGDPLSLLCPPTPTVGSVRHSWCKMKQGKVCDYEVGDKKCPTMTQ